MKTVKNILIVSMLFLCACMDMYNDTFKDADIEYDTYIKTIAGCPPPTFPSDSGSNDADIGTDARFSAPQELAIIGDTIYVADAGNGEIRCIDINTTKVTTYATGMITPAGITSDGSNLYVTSRSGFVVYKIDMDTKAVSIIAGSGSPGYADGLGTSAQFTQPRGIVYHNSSLYVTDATNDRIRKISIPDYYVSTIAGNGAKTSVDGNGTSASIYNPIGITTDGNNLYVADNLGDRIRQVVIGTWDVTTVAGTTVNSFLDGYGTDAAFNDPVGIVYNNGYLYVSDQNNRSIREIRLSDKQVKSILGSEPPVINGDGYADGKGTDALVYNPKGLAIKDSNMYLIDTGNNSVRKIYRVKR